MDNKSKSELKREMTSLQELGKRLVDLPDKQLSRIALPEELQNAISLAKTLKSHSALRRQLQFIGVLMRKIDVGPIRQAVLEIDEGQKNKIREFQHLELLRDSLIEEDDSVIEKIISRFPDADIQRLRQFIRNARKEKKENKPPAQSRALFKYLRGLSARD
jgi:ribosome-associated protein